jgi:hypothetical protein
VQKALGGSVTFTNNEAIVALQTPIFADDDHIVQYEPYKMNGRYKLSCMLRK